MRADEAVEQVTKKTYVKPTLATHGSVQQLTEGGHRSHDQDHGSGIKLPVNLGHDSWSWDW